MTQPYHIAAREDPPNEPVETPTPFRPPVPGEPSIVPPSPIIEPPLLPPGTETPGFPIPGPITL
jgi:hypothetical protein